MTDGTYLITVRGVAGPWVRGVFDDTEVSVVGDTTVLRRAGTDQAALHGLLRRIWDLGLEVIEERPHPGTRDTADGDHVGAIGHLSDLLILIPTGNRRTG